MAGSIAAPDDFIDLWRGLSSVESERFALVVGNPGTDWPHQLHYEHAHWSGKAFPTSYWNCGVYACNIQAPPLEIDWKADAGWLNLHEICKQQTWCQRCFIEHLQLPLHLSSPKPCFYTLLQEQQEEWREMFFQEFGCESTNYSSLAPYDNCHLNGCQIALSNWRRWSQG